MKTTTQKASSVMKKTQKKLRLSKNDTKETVNKGKRDYLKNLPIYT